MSESIEHIELVQQLVKWIINSLTSKRSGYILVDCSMYPRKRKPPKVGEYVPDVYVTPNPKYECIIGEAKTRKDLENIHTEKQIIAFLRKCSEYEKSIFVLAIPWDIVGEATSLLNYCKKQNGFESVKTVVLEKLKG